MSKTYIGSEKSLELLNIGIKKILCVCQKSKIADWLNQYKDNYSIKVYDLTKDVSGFIVEREKCVGVINYDLLIRREVLKSVSNFVLILDESSLIQNDKSKRCKFIMDLLPSAVILLSGTPGKYEKLWTQCRLLNWDISKTQYENRYINYDLRDFHVGFPIKVLNKENPYRNVDDLKRRLREHGAIFKKTEEVIDLPPQNFIDIKVNNTSEYREYLRDRVIKINDDELVGDHTFRHYLYKRLLCSVYNDNKIEALKDLMESTDDRLVIFYNWDKELKLLRDICKNIDRPISEMNGHIKDLTNYEKYSDSVTLVHFVSGAMGINLQLANKIIYFTPTDKSENYAQSIKRIHRIGQNSPCFYYRLIVRASIEEKIYESLERQEDFKDYLFV